MDISTAWVIWAVIAIILTFFGLMQYIVVDKKNVIICATIWIAPVALRAMIMVLLS
jgi:hypothetical protein